MTPDTPAVDDETPEEHAPSAPMPAASPLSASAEPLTPEKVAVLLEGALLAAGRALSVDDFVTLFEGHAQAPDRAQIREGLSALDEVLADRAIELVRVASGYRLQVRSQHSSWLAGLFSERPPRYSRALLETLALIVYRQPITRGEIEEVRGVAVSTNIIKTLMEREWIRVLGHREVPGRPALYGTTRSFLDHFGLKNLDGLPALAELKDLDQAEQDLFASLPEARAAEEGTSDEVDESALEAATQDGAHDDTSNDTQVAADSAPAVADEYSDDEVGAASQTHDLESALDAAARAPADETSVDASPQIGDVDGDDGDTPGDAALATAGEDAQHGDVEEALDLGGAEDTQDSETARRESS